MTLFLAGPLRDDQIRRVVMGDVPVREARLPGHRAVVAAGSDEPAFASGSGVPGLLADPGPDALARADWYAAGCGLVPSRVVVEAPGGPVAAILHHPGDAAATEASWDLAAWQMRHGPHMRRAAAEAMALYGGMDGAGLRARLPNIRSRAFAAERARAAPQPRSLRAATGAERIEVAAIRRPYTEFFAMRECTLRHPTFDGGTSDWLDRAGFVSGDAVTVLPYDPVRDRVLLVEQVRMGPYLRGDPFPWVLEPVAGRIEAGEDAETAVRREAEEEAHLTLRALHRVGGYYASPGAVTEFVESYIGLADLPDGSEGLGGAAEEGEDIRAHVIPFARLMDMVDTGEVATGPLLVSALWLARARADGRFG